MDGFGITSRNDLWWLRPLLVLIGLSSFIVYATWAAFQGDHYAIGPYLSPFYSPEIFGDSPHSWFGPKPGWWPAVIPFSPAILILWAPGGMRFTCYYYRGAYYKSFWADFHEPTDKEIEHLSTTFHFHPLAIEDCVQRLHRPKLDYYENHTFYVTHSVLKESSELIKNELNFFVGANFIVSFHRMPALEISQVWDRLCGANNV